MNNTPSKRRTKAHPVSPLRRHNNLAHASDDESDSEGPVGEAEKEIQEPEKIFHCKFAIDSRRSVFYSFKWERHQKDALAKSAPLSIEAGPSSQKDPWWGEGRHWDIEEKQETLSTRHSQKSKLKHDASESDANSSEEYQDHDTLTDLDEIEEVQASESDKEASDESDDIFDLHTPSKKRKHGKSSAVTPRRPKRTKILAEVTPHSLKGRSRKEKEAYPHFPKTQIPCGFPCPLSCTIIGFSSWLDSYPLVAINAHTSCW